MPALGHPGPATTRLAVAAAIEQQAGLQAVDHRYQGWIGLEIGASIRRAPHRWCGGTIEA